MTASFVTQAVPGYLIFLDAEGNESPPIDFHFPGPILPGSSYSVVAEDGFENELPEPLRAVTAWDHFDVEHCLSLKNRCVVPVVRLCPTGQFQTVKTLREQRRSAAPSEGCKP